MASPAAEPEQVRAALAGATGSHAEVEVRETHISWVFLTADRAYKLKKPLVLPFLDYGTPARRRELCREEVRLNSRLAPDVYIGVLALRANGNSAGATRPGLALVDEDDPRAIDYLVEMRRFDPSRTMAATLNRGELARADIVAVAQMLADFHAACARAPLPANPAHAVQREIDLNFAELLPLVELRTERERVLALWRFQSAFIAARTSLLDARARRGLVRDGHGDLRAEHVLLGHAPEAVDCVEFDPALRSLDIADDIAFLVMDLTALGGEHAATELLSAYREAGGDLGPDALVAFYACYRALVRAKVQLLRAAQLRPGSGAQGQASARARDLVALAEHFAWRARLPLLVIVCGVPASGKSHLSAALSRASSLAHISSDVTRKQLAGLRPSEPAGAERYRDEFSRATYSELGWRAVAEVAARGGVIVDATFRRAADREQFATAFAGSAPVVFIECVAPAAALAERAIARGRDERHGSDATIGVVMRERERWQPLDEVRGDAHLLVRTDRPVEQILAEIMTVLDERLWRAASSS